MAFKPSQRRRREEEDVDLNITPIMNLMVVLIPLLLSTAQFTQLALLEYLPPAAAEEGGGGGGGDDQENTEKEKTLSLLVNLTPEAIQISIFGKVEAGPYFYEIPRKLTGEYNLEALNDSLFSIKKREVGELTGLDSTQNPTNFSWMVFPTYAIKDGRELSLTAVAETPFQTIVDVMDVCRTHEAEDGIVTELFPLTLLKQFQ